VIVFEASLHKDSCERVRLLHCDEAVDEEEDNRDADDGAHRDDELLAKLLDPERNQHLTDDETDDDIQRWASSLYDSEDESAAPSSLPVEATTPELLDFSCEPPAACNMSFRLCCWSHHR